MKDREFVFRRKNDYKDDVIAWIKSLKKSTRIFFLSPIQTVSKVIIKDWFFMKR